MFCIFCNFCIFWNSSAIRMAPVVMRARNDSLLLLRRSSAAWSAQRSARSVVVIVSGCCGCERCWLRCHEGCWLIVSGMRAEEAGPIAKLCRSPDPPMFIEGLDVMNYIFVYLNIQELQNYKIYIKY